MASMCGKRFKYLRNGFTIWEMTYICGKWLIYVGKWLNYLTNGLNMWKMTQRFWKCPKYVGNGLDTWGTA